MTNNLPCDDAISREDVLAEITRFSTEEGASVECQQLYCDVNNLPSVTQKSGKWIDYRDNGFVECPFCGHATNCEDNIDELHYCFYCGAEMVEPQESEDKE